VLPSDLEGLPIVLLEALGYGTPVLASDITPNVEVLGTYGRTFTAGSTEALKAAMAACIDELAELKTEALTAREAIGMRYNWDAVTRQTDAVYSSTRTPLPSRE